MAIAASPLASLDHSRIVYRRLAVITLYVMAVFWGAMQMLTSNNGLLGMLCAMGFATSATMWFWIDCHMRSRPLPWSLFFDLAAGVSDLLDGVARHAGIRLLVAPRGGIMRDGSVVITFCDDAVGVARHQRGCIESFHCERINQTCRPSGSRKRSLLHRASAWAVFRVSCCQASQAFERERPTSR